MEVDRISGTLEVQEPFADQHVVEDTDTQDEKVQQMSTWMDLLLGAGTPG